MSTWQIVSDVENGFSWEISQQLPDESLRSSVSHSNSISRLPSMSDLLLQECRNVPIPTNDEVNSPPMFRSGSGKAVTVKQSSISKALSILGDDGGELSDAGNLFGGSSNICSNSMFMTGSGKKVNISSTGLARAKTLLGLGDNNDTETSPMLKQSVNQSSFLEMKTNVMNIGSDPVTPFSSKNILPETFSRNEMIPDLLCGDKKTPPIKFHTAGGRSLSVSSGALQRAMNLLGGPDMDFTNETEDNSPSISKQGEISDVSASKLRNPRSIVSCKEISRKSMPKIFVSPLRSAPDGKHTSIELNNVISGVNLSKAFKAADCDDTCQPSDITPSRRKPPRSRYDISGDSLTSGVRLNANAKESPGRVLTDISNTIRISDADKQLTGGKRSLGGRNSVSPFKRPRTAKFIAPLNIISSDSIDAEESSNRRKLTTCYPFQSSRAYIKEYLVVPPFHTDVKNLPEQIKKMDSYSAESYTFDDIVGVKSMGVEAFHVLLMESGASAHHASKEWVANHYKWIVWKLACYERCYASKFSGNLLTVSNVLAEIKYRYDREANHGHRSAIKKILEGDQPPSSMLVLCIASISDSSGELKRETQPVASNGTESGKTWTLELTDGWYSLNAVLDASLRHNLAAGKLFVGQKLRVWGAGLCNWVGPVTPFEASNSVSLQLHINGTYRAHWSDRLGICKGVGVPLAFNCIKAFGGSVPCTVIGVQRIYPVLYRERLTGGGFIVRSERMEESIVELYNQRRSAVAEGIMSEFQSTRDNTNNDNTSEGAKILKMLENAAEPEVLMAEMSLEQLTSFATYKAKLEATRESDMKKSLEKSLGDAGLDSRNVFPFMRVRVVGLTVKNRKMKRCSGRGIITIWNPSEKLKLQLVEGKAYSVAGLVPLSLDVENLYLQAKESSTKWLPLSEMAVKNFKSFFSPRQNMPISKLDEIPLSSEFDIAAVVVYVGEVFADANQKKQWVFVTDGSIFKSQCEGSSTSLLAISFSSPNLNCDSYAPVSHKLVGSVLGFCNIIKRVMDQKNHLYVAETTENSIYFLSCDHLSCSHLKEAATSVERWAKSSPSTADELREKITSIIHR
ncbi:protein BREAST CANCER SUSCEPTIBILITY 2 homolog B-like [Impatiens glandulifera]|uniref:protein BREAST CANCER SUSCEPTIBILITY 2 homolog B-like n=1 Tax=Impatiens glandulifera TaxID=253017 RepID=UPI001FB0BD5C|nr:protein BREAST CANCER SUSCEPTIBILITY 2 homolog B-like [Impatiens glandulifera]